MIQLRKTDERKSNPKYIQRVALFGIQQEGEACGCRQVWRLGWDYEGTDTQPCIFSEVQNAYEILCPGGAFKRDERDIILTVLVLNMHSSCLVLRTQQGINEQNKVSKKTFPDQPSHVVKVPCRGQEAKISKSISNLTVE